MPTAWQAVVYADVPAGGSLAVFGLGPIGQMCIRAARVRGVDQVFGVDRVGERLDLARRYGAEVIDARADDVVLALRERTAGRGPDSVIDAVGLEAHGSPVAAMMQTARGKLPKRLAAPLAERAGVDRLNALRTAIAAVRRGGTLSIVGVYGGGADPLPMLQLFDKGVQIRMGQAHVKRWIDDLLPLLLDETDPLGTADFITHWLPLDEAARGYEMFQKKQDGAIKVVLRP